MYAADPNVFVAGDLLWYAEKGNPAERMAPDAMVIFGRPKGYRGSYMQWKEDGIAPQVVFEVLSPGNRPEEMDRKFAFYDRHGVEEYYIYDPDYVRLEAWRRVDGRLRPVARVDGYVSPRLGITFDLSGKELVVLRPDKSRFLSFLELDEEFQRSCRERQEALQAVAETAEREARARREAIEATVREDVARREATEARRDATEARRDATEAATREAQARREAEAANRRLEQLAARLRQLGIDPDAPAPAQE
jgi:hypothetical protein